jgi:hypothetical protein
VSKLRELSGAQWVDDVCMISLEEDHYLGHIKVCLDAYCDNPTRNNSILSPRPLHLVIKRQ